MASSGPQPSKMPQASPLLSMCLLNSFYIAGTVSGSNKDKTKQVPGKDGKKNQGP